MPIGMRVDAVFCGDNCRVNAHKKQKRESRKEFLLAENYFPIVAFPNGEQWTSLIAQMKQHYPKEYLAVGYRLMRKGSIYPNPKDRLRSVDNEFRDEPYYHWNPFEPPSVPEPGDYKLQWWIGPDAVTPDFDAESVPTCSVPIADPQARFHNNHANKTRMSAAAWTRQVKLKMKRFKGS